MQVTETLNEGLKREYKVTVEADVIGNKVQNRLVDLSKKVKLPGFRPGKVPLSLVTKNYGESVMNEVLEELLGSTTQEVIAEKKIRPAMQPEIKIVSFKPNEPLEYSIAFELFPDIAIPDFKTISLEKLVVAVEDTDVEEGLNRMLTANSDYKRIEKSRAAKSGDAVIMDFLGKIDGVPFDGGKGEKFRLVLGSKQFIDGFEDQLIGMKEGASKTIDVTFPADYGSAELAGKPSQFDVTIHEILEPVTAEASDEFAKKVGIESLEKLKEMIRDRIEYDFKEASRTRLKKVLFDALEKCCDYDIPKGMVDSEFNTLWKQALQEAEHNPGYFSEGEEAAKEEYQKMSQRRVRLGLLLAEIGRTQNITVGQDEIRQSIYNQARQYPGQEHKIVEFYRKSPEALEQLKGPILEEKAVDFILEQVTLKEKSLTSKEMIKLFEAEEAAA